MAYFSRVAASAFANGGIEIFKAFEDEARRLNAVPQIAQEEFVKNFTKSVKHEKTLVIPSEVQEAKRPERSRGNEVSLSVFYKNKTGNLTINASALRSAQSWDCPTSHWLSRYARLLHFASRSLS